MPRRILSALLVACALAAAAVGTAGMSAVVELRVRDRILSAPATVRVIVRVEPNQANRTLRVEADGESMFSATERTLEGVGEKRLHEVLFRDVPAGNYTIRAAVLAGQTVRGEAIASVQVVSAAPR